MKVNCPFIHICENYGKKCDKCNYNTNARLNTYLVVDKEDEKKSYRILEK